MADLETQPTTDPGPAADPVPEGALDIDVQGQKQKMVPVAALVAERERIRHTERERFTKEVEPLKAKAAERDQIAADLQALQPHLEYLKAHPDLLTKDQPPELKAVSDEAAEQYARDYELYTPTGLDLNKAKRMIAKHTAEMRQVATQAAQEAVRPALETSAIHASRQNFVWAAQQRGPDGRALVNPEVLAAEWAKLPAELTSKPEVAQWILRAAIGESALSGRQAPSAPTHDPVFTEAPGRRGQTYQISDLERKMAKSAGIDEGAWSKQAQAYQPDSINVLGD